MAADKTEHFEVWYAEADGKQRHAKADDEEQAAQIAADLHLEGFDDISVHKLTTSVTTSVVKVDLPDRDAVAVTDSTG